jgi:hypothetical protein
MWRSFVAWTFAWEKLVDRVRQIGGAPLKAKSGDRRRGEWDLEILIAVSESQVQEG